MSLFYCQGSDEAVKAIAGLDSLESLRLQYCSGFTDLTPLAKMPGLKELSVLGDMSAPEVLDGEAWFGEDFPYITQLSLSGYEKMAGTGFLRHFPALESFYLPLEGYDSLEFFNDMDHMRQIEIGADLSGLDLSPIGNCRRLESLRLGGTGIADLSMVQGMEELAVLDVAGCQITDISPLQGCPKLQSLYMDENQIRDVSCLEGKEELHTVCLNQNQIEDIRPLAGLGLWHLELGENRIQDISPLSACGELQYLYLQGNQIRDVSSLAGCRKLEYLNLSGNRLENLAGCESMIALTSFYAKDNQITDLTGIANSTAIRYLDVSGNQIGDLDALGGGFTSLRGVNISGNQVEDIAVLGTCGELRFFMADHNQIASLAPLKNAPELNLVFADGNRLTDLEGLGGKENLFAVTAYGNQLENIQALSSCPNLLYLDLGQNQIRDIAPFHGLSPNQKGFVFLEHNQIQDFSLFPVDPGYTLLALYGNPAKDLTSISKIEDANSFNDSFYLSYGEYTDDKALGEQDMGGALYLVDAPLGEQAAILKQAEESDVSRVKGGIRFAGLEEADKELARRRTEMKEECTRDLQMLEGDGAIASLVQ